MEEHSYWLPTILTRVFNSMNCSAFGKKKGRDKHVREAFELKSIDYLILPFVLSIFIYQCM